ncbi:MAG: hypothetical protein WCK77_14270 [Verrucomicrobiota bacterium]
MKLSYFCLGFLIVSAAACKHERDVKVYHVAKDAAPAAPAPGESAADPHAGMPGMTPGTAGGDPHAGLSAEQLAAGGAATSPATQASPQFTDSPPAHWKKQALSPMRLASYHVEGDGGAMSDISFTQLRRAPGGTLANINRWRDQLGQPPIDEAALKQASQTIKSSFGDAIAVDLEGIAPGADVLKDGRLVGAIAEEGENAWFFKMRGNAALTATEKANFFKWIETVKPAPADSAPAAPAPAGTAPAPLAPAVPAPAPAAGAAAPAPAGDGSLTWTLPDGWTPGAASAARYATFSVAGADGAKAELAISHFPGDVGGDLANVNRWRQQIGLPAIEAAALPPLVTKLSAGTDSFSLIDATGAQARLVAGWTRHGADTWFFKFTGPDALVAAEKAKFTAFLASVRFTKPE